MRHALIVILLAVALAAPAAATAQAADVEIGVLAKRGPERALERWQPTADYLTAAVPGHRFEVVPLDFDAIFEAVKGGEVDFVLANSSIYVTMAARHGVSRIATLRNTDGPCGDCFGGVIFTRADNDEIREIGDLRGRSFMAVDPTSLGGFQMAWRTLQEQGIDVHREFAELRFGGTHDAVVHAVLAGEVAAGTVRTDTLERMAREGRLSLGEVRVINPRTESGFGFLLSTRLYPEWPMARLADTDLELSRQVAVALMDMAADAPAARAGLYAGWEVPQNYQPVRELQRILRIGPYEGHGSFSLRDVLARYWPVVVLLALLLVVLTAGNLVFSRLIRRLRSSEGALREARNHLEQRVEQRTAELSRQRELLARDQARLQEAQRVAALGNWEWNWQSGGFWWSDEVYRILGADPASVEPTRENLVELSHPDDRSRLLGALTRARFEDEAVEIDHRLAADAGKRVLHQRIKALRDGRGQVSRIIGTVQDVTEERQSAERLRLAATVFDSSTEGIVVTDADGCIQAVNAAFTEITGYFEDEVRGRNPSLLKSGHHDQAFYDNLWETLRHRGSWQGEIWNRRRDGVIYPEWETISAVHDDHGNITNYVGVFSDLSSLQEAQERLDYISRHDLLTGLPNRVMLEERLARAIDRAKDEGEVVGVAFLDLDRFKNINDSLGQPAGDRVLQQIAERLLEILPAKDLLGRVGSDEFVLVAESVADADDMRRLAERLMGVFNRPFVVDDEELRLEASVGIALYPDDGRQAVELIRNADTAVYRAKEEGRNRSRFYTPELTDSARERLRLEMALRRAVHQRALDVVFQPQMALAGDRVVGAEALVRWHDPDHGAVSPGEFIPIAEDAGLIVELGDFVMRSACATLQRLRTEGFSLDRVAVNVSAIEVREGDLVERVQAALETTGLPAECLDLEVTEGVFLDQTERALETFERLRTLGVRVSVDDFGTGYSSLAYLQRLPLDQLKIDKSFVDALSAADAHGAIPRAVIALGHSLDLCVLAEGVETAEQRDWLVEHGCDEAQGFFFARPLSGRAFRAFLEERAQASRPADPG